MDFNLNKDNPLFKQHVITCGRHVILRQEEVEPSPIWLARSVISISDTEAEEVAMRDCFWGCNGVLYLMFADDDASFTEVHARQIYDHVYKHHRDNFLVHCFLGCSRSVAVAKWMVEYLGVDDLELTEIKSFNHHVYNTLVEHQKLRQVAQCV